MEEWKRIVYNGVEYEYEVSTKGGKVRNIKTGRIMSEFISNDGYAFVVLSLNGKKKRFSVHRLVATMFIPNPDNLPEVDHIDRNRSNNSVENLRWVSHRDNVLHKEYGQRRVKCVETGQIFESILQASAETGCERGNIVDCCRGKRKTCRGFHWEYVD